MSDAGGQSPAPLNAPPSGAVTTGVQPGISNGIILARVIVISGSGGTVDGLFVYNGVPGFGNPPVYSVTESSTDPFGNPVKQIAVLQGQGSYAARYIQMAFAAGGLPTLSIGTGASDEAFPAELFTKIVNAGLANQYLGMLINSPENTNREDAAGIALQSSADDLSGSAGGNLYYVTAGGVQTDILEWGSGGIFVNMPQDGQSYNVAQKTLYASGQAVTSTSFVPVTGMSQAVGANRYRIKGTIMLECVTADTLLFAFSGPAISSGAVDWIVYPIENSNTAAAQQWTFRQENNLAGARTPAMTAGQLWTMTFNGEYVFSAAGTFGLEVATLAGNTIDVLTQSFFDIALQIV